MYFYDSFDRLYTKSEGFKLEYHINHNHFEGLTKIYYCTYFLVAPGCLLQEEEYIFK